MAKRVKVCFVSIFAYHLFNCNSELNFGGAEVQMSILAKELAKDFEFDVNFIVGDFGQKDLEIYNNVKLHKSYKLGRNLLNLIRATSQLYFVLKKICPDIVIARAAGAETGISAFYCRLNKKKFIYSIAHDNDANGNNFRGLRGKIFKYGFMNADRLIAQSNNQAAMLEKFYLAKTDSILIRNSLPILPKLNIHKKGILWVGRSVNIKRPQIFINLAKDFPTEKFTMIIRKNNLNIWENIKKQAENIKNLKFIGGVPFDQVGKYFKEAKIFVNTSKKEGFPNTFLQAALNSVPIVSLNVNPDRLITKYQCGIFCNNDYEKLKNSLSKLLHNQKYYNLLAGNCLNYVRKNHNIKDNIIEWKEAIKKIL